MGQTSLAIDQEVDAVCLRGIHVSFSAEYSFSKCQYYIANSYVIELDCHK